MKLVVITALALLGCKDDKPREAPAPQPAPPPATAVDAQPQGPDLCKLGSTAVDQATCAKPETKQTLLKAKKSLDGVVQTVGQTSADPVQFQVMCAQLVLAIERDAKKADCTLAISDAQRAEMMAVLDAWYGRRT